jgi:hypothetical protein
MVFAKAGMQEKEAALKLFENINRIEAAFRTNFPQVRWIFVEPDVRY